MSAEQQKDGETQYEQGKLTKPYRLKRKTITLDELFTLLEHLLVSTR